MTYKCSLKLSNDLYMSHFVYYLKQSLSVINSKFVSYSVQILPKCNL